MGSYHVEIMILCYWGTVLLPKLIITRTYSNLEFWFDLILYITAQFNPIVFNEHQLYYLMCETYVSRYCDIDIRGEILMIIMI